MQATYRHGWPLMADHTPNAAVAAGDVIVVGTRVCIAHSAIAADALGAVAVGGGVYDVTADAALAAGAKVYWDDTANKVTATAGANKVFGYVAPGSSSAADGDTIRAVHDGSA